MLGLINQLMYVSSLKLPLFQPIGLKRLGYRIIPSLYRRRLNCHWR